VYEEEFECDGALEAGVFGFVDDTHTAFAELVEDLVVRDSLADHGKPTRTCMIPTARGTNGMAVKYDREPG
jgi:hypothetical protein